MRGTRKYDVCTFWLEELSEKDWYAGGDQLDAICRERFAEDLNHLSEGGHQSWISCADGALAYILLADQLSRNIHRGTALAFATDALARRASKTAIAKGWDLQIDPPARQFFYLPLEHSESLQDQSRSVRLMLMRLSEQTETILHARAHREVIRRFGRFPTRNEALGRTSSPAERAYIDGHGYADLLKTLRSS